MKISCISKAKYQLFFCYFEKPFVLRGDHGGTARSPPPPPHHFFLLPYPFRRRSYSSESRDEQWVFGDSANARNVSPFRGW